MKFTKMHGIGNDYVYVNCMSENIANPGKIAERISDRHFGIGSDGLILIKPSQKADFYMEMYNADGTQGEMCGNGIRCVAKYVYDKGLTAKEYIEIETLSGIKKLDLNIRDGKMESARVNMGKPILLPKDIPVLFEGERCIARPIQVNGKQYEVTCVSMGNPHAVVFMEDVAGLRIEQIGPYFENHEKFPNRINTEFIHVLDDHTLQMRVWERGAGETLACGTGACAAVVASALNGLTKNDVTVRLLRGELQIQWNKEEDVVYMTGPAETVFEGEIHID